MPTIFFDFDSTVCTKESLDEVISLALEGHQYQALLVSQVEDITNRGMSGELDFIESVKARFEVCPLDLSHFEIVGKNLTQSLTLGMDHLFSWLKNEGWTVYIISGGFRPSILPSAQVLGLTEDQVFTNDVVCDDQGMIKEIDESSWLWTNEGKARVVNFLRTQKNSEGPFVLIGDGANDLAAFSAGAVDHFVGFGANVAREKIKVKAPNFVYSTDELKILLQKIS